MLEGYSFQVKLVKDPKMPTQDEEDRYAGMEGYEYRGHFRKYIGTYILGVFVLGVLVGMRLNNQQPTQVFLTDRPRYLA